MKSNPKILRDNFNFLGHFYNPLKRFFMGNAPEKIIAKCVPKVGFHPHVLVVGGGADNTIIELIRNRKCNHITHLDISKVLSSKSFLRLDQEGFDGEIKVDYIVQSFLEYDSKVKFDSVVFPFYLDLFLDSEIEENIRKINQLLRPKGTVYVIDFSSSTKSNYWQRFKEHSLYFLFYPITKTWRSTFPNHKTLFENCGYDEVEIETFKNGFYKYSSFVAQGLQPVNNP